MIDYRRHGKSEAGIRAALHYSKAGKKVAICTADEAATLNRIRAIEPRMLVEVREGILIPRPRQRKVPNP
jgi:hypothetical protein